MYGLLPEPQRKRVELEGMKARGRHTLIFSLVPFFLLCYKATSFCQSLEGKWLLGRHHIWWLW